MSVELRCLVLMDLNFLLVQDAENLNGAVNPYYEVDDEKNH